MVVTDYIGIDPDLHTPAIAVVRRASGPGRLPVVVFAGVLMRVPPRRKGAEALADAAEESSSAVRPLRMIRSPEYATVVAVEMPRQYPGSKTRPQDIVHLAASSGIWAAAVMASGRGEPHDRSLFPYAQEWKGSVPKAIHQARICKRLGWAYEVAGGRSGYCVPSQSSLPLCCTSVRAADWKHVLDAVGLALWAFDQLPEDA